MKFILCILIISEVEFLHGSGVNNYNFFPNLPMGPYKGIIKAILKCHSQSNPSIQQNFYVYKISDNTIQIKGNLTCKIPLDDSFTMNVNFAVKDSIGGWKDNAHIISYPRACTSMKNIFGVQWPIFLNAYGINDTNCPIKTGVYTSKNGFTIDKAVEDSLNFPKTFFYGSYKARVYFENTLGHQVGCVIFVVEVKRPWETE